MNELYDKNKTLIGLILLLIIVFSYVYFTRSTLSRNDIVFLEGTLKEKPFLGEQGGDMPRPFIRILLIENDKKFYFKDCGYYQVKRQNVLNLALKKQVKIGVRKEDLDKNKIDICHFSYDKNILLDIDDYNSCYVTYWKYLLPPLIIMFLILFYRIFRGIYYNRNHK